MPRLHRRRFLQATGAGLAALHLPFLTSFRTPGRSDDEPLSSLVVLFLRGGQDPLHSLVPYGDRHYRALRPTLRVPEEAGDDGPGVVRLDSTFGLHPALAALEPLWKKKKLAAVVNVGSPHPTRSHFDAQDFMEYAAPGLRTVRSGWLNRYLEGTRRAPAKEGEEEPLRLRGLAMQGLLPRALRGTHPALAVPNQDVIEDEWVLDLFSDLYAKQSGMESMEDTSTGEDAVFDYEAYFEGEPYPHGGPSIRLTSWVVISR